MGGLLPAATLGHQTGAVATQKRTLDHLLEQATGTGTVSTKPMFGEYSIFVDGK